MEIIRHKKDIFVRISRDEAMKIIKSLSEQIISNSPNVGREESYSEKGEYFTIAVIQKDQKEKVVAWKYNTEIMDQD